MPEEVEVWVWCVPEGECLRGVGVSGVGPSVGPGNHGLRVAAVRETGGERREEREGRMGDSRDGRGKRGFGGWTV